jgi:hypothetical protein
MMYTVKDGTSLALKISGPHTKSCGIASDPFFRDLFLRHHRHKSAPIYYKQDEKSGKKYGLIYLRLEIYAVLWDESTSGSGTRKSSWHYFYHTAE